MQDTIDILDYSIHWMSKSETGFIGELFHVAPNNSDGSWNTPVGYVIGFIEPANEYSDSHWKIIITVRKEIRYDESQNFTYVFVKSAYASKLKFIIQKISEFTQKIIRINPNLPIAIQEELIKAKICSSPLSVQTIVGKDEYVYSNVEFSLD